MLQRACWRTLVACLLPPLCRQQGGQRDTVIAWCCRDGCNQHHCWCYSTRAVRAPGKACAAAGGSVHAMHVSMSCASPYRSAACRSARPGRLTKSLAQQLHAVRGPAACRTWHVRAHAHAQRPLPTATGMCLHTQHCQHSSTTHARSWRCQLVHHPTPPHTRRCWHQLSRHPTALLYTVHCTPALRAGIPSPAGLQ